MKLIFLLSKNNLPFLSLYSLSLYKLFGLIFSVFFTAPHISNSFKSCALPDPRRKMAKTISSLGEHLAAVKIRRFKWTLTELVIKDCPQWCRFYLISRPQYSRNYLGAIQRIRDTFLHFSDPPSPHVTFNVKK